MDRSSMSERFDIPDHLQSTLVPEIMSETDSVTFNCHKGVSCYNACCKEADITLTPYDVIRLKQHFDVDSSEFLKVHTVPFEMDGDGLPGVKMRTDDNGVCAQMTKEGCGVYESRPAACRYYGMGVMSRRDKDTYEDYLVFFKNKEDICKGWDEDKTQTVQEYREEQGVVEYDELSREWMQLILKKKSAGPAVGKPSEMSLQLFFLASFDLDRFRRFIQSPSFQKTYTLSPEEYAEILSDDVNVMKFGYRLMKHVLFGEVSIPMVENAYEERYEERKDIIKMRYDAEVAAARDKAEADKIAMLKEDDARES